MISHIQWTPFQLDRKVLNAEPGRTGKVRLKILAAVTGWGKFLQLLHIFGLLRWDATHLASHRDREV